MKTRLSLRSAIHQCKELKMANSMYLPVALAASLLAGCASNDDLVKAKYDKENDPRVGDEIERVCFNNNISGWSDVDNDNNALLVHFGAKRSYKVKLIGMCEADWAMARIAVVSRIGSSCMSVGDKIVTDAQMNSLSSCTITDIYEWHDVEPEQTVSN